MNKIDFLKIYKPQLIKQLYEMDKDTEKLWGYSEVKALEDFYDDRIKMRNL